MSVYETLSKINVNDRTEKKGKLTYLSWAWAWTVVKENYPEAYYTIYENEKGWNYFTDGRTCWVKTGVTIEGLEHIEYLPVMDNRNDSITYEYVTSTDINKAIQRSLTKACARHGLGLYIYAGEDLPSDVIEFDKELLDSIPANIAKNMMRDKISAEELQAVVAKGKPGTARNFTAETTFDQYDDEVKLWIHQHWPKIVETIKNKRGN